MPEPRQPFSGTRGARGEGAGDAAGGQLLLPLSLDFPGRTSLTIAEVAARLAVSEQHIVNFIADGSLPAVDLRGASATRSTKRVPLEAYRDFVAARLSAPLRPALLDALPVPQRVALIAEVVAGLPPDAREQARRVIAWRQANSDR